MEQSRRALELVTRIGEVLLKNGGEIFRVQQTMQLVAKAYGIPGFQVYVLANGLFVSMQEEGRTITRPVDRGDAAAQAPPPAQAPQELEGEAALRAQSVSPAQVAAWNEAFSYDAGRTARQTRDQETPLSREEEERVIQRVLKDLNYNRMADEVLDRVERRLRTERRKIGR